MRTLILWFALFTLILASCMPAQVIPPPPTATVALMNTPAPSVTPPPTATPTPKATATPRPYAEISSSTFLFPVPDNTLTDGMPLTIGTGVYLIAQYGDFAKVEMAGQKGFVPLSALAQVPTSLPIMDENAVPWVDATVDLESHLTINQYTFVDGKAIVVDNSKYDYYNDLVPYTMRPYAAFRLAFQIGTSDKQFGSIKLADKPNTDDPQWWKGIRRVDFATHKGYLQIDLRDGRTENSATTIRLGIRDAQVITVTFLDAQGTVFSISDQNGREVRRVDVRKVGLDFPEGLFPDKTVYIGRVVSPHSILTIQSLSLQWLPEGRFVSREPTLRALAERCGVSLGTEFSWWRMQDPRYYNLIFENYNTLILSEFSWNGFWHGRGDYDFESLDRIVDWAVRHGFRVRAYHLVWGATEESSAVIPDWLRNGNFSRDEYIQILKEHVTTIVSHYKGRVTEWSIANEAVSRSAWRGSDFWMDKIGPQYIEMSFQWAREAEPNAVLIFNDNNNESPRDGETKRIINSMYQTVKNLKAKGIPIDVVGMQMHLLLKYSSPIAPKKQDVIDTMRKFGELGVKIYITEFDVDVHRVPSTQQERWQYQANLYRDMLEACLESGGCTSFATWGVSDSTSWITCQEQWCVNVPDADPLMFDKDFKPKPAYSAVMDVLSKCTQQPLTPAPSSTP